LIESIIETIGSNDLLRQRAGYQVIGSIADGYQNDIQRLIRQFHLSEQVQLLRRRSNADFAHCLASADVVLDLRDPDRGESLWGWVQALFAGKTVVARQLTELPDDVVVKLENVESLGETLCNLCSDVSLRAAY